MSARAGRTPSRSADRLHAIVRSEPAAGTPSSAWNAIADGLRMIAAGPYSAVIGGSTGPL